MRVIYNKCATFSNTTKRIFHNIIHSNSELPESGWCLDQHGQEQKEGVWTFPGLFTWDECLRSCKDQLPRATACEWYENGNCGYHTKAVSGGSGDKDWIKCQKLGNVIDISK